jgi:hypothetical protein
MSSTIVNPVLKSLFGQAAGVPIPPGQINDFLAGFQQAAGKNLVIDGDYLWKITHNGYDFSDFLNSPIFFPISWHNSKINGFSVRASVPNYHGLTAYVMFSGVASRFFLPQVGGLGTDLALPVLGVFRIDHDQKFQQTTHLQYQPRKNLPWIALNWRYDNGLVAGAAPCFNASPGLENGCASTSFIDSKGVARVDASALTADQQFQAGLFCGSVHATPTTPISPDSSCPAAQFGSTLIKIPAPGTENDDRNPKRINPRNLFDMSLGDDNLFRKDHYRWSLRLTIINVGNKLALYNFISTFSGTHYLTPRTTTAELGFHF